MYREKEKYRKMLECILASWKKCRKSKSLDQWIERVEKALESGN